MSVCPGYVSTEMTDYKKVDFITSTPADTVCSSLVDLGRGRKRTMGSFKHKWVQFKRDLMPELLGRWLLKSKSEGKLKEEQKQQPEKEKPNETPKDSSNHQQQEREKKSLEEKRERKTKDD